MLRSDFIKEVKERAGITNTKEAKFIVDSIGNIIIEHMSDEDGISPWTGMKFYSVYKESYIGRNPATGGDIEVPAKFMPKVKFGKSVKLAVNEE